jgi:Holliday junction DNA helicase RuvA
MIARIAGTLLAKELDRVEIMTSGGVGYELLIPLGVFETLPRTGEATVLHTHLVVKEDGWQLFGFATDFERQVFTRVLGAKGVGPSLALGLLSALTGARLVRALREHDVATLQSVPGRRRGRRAWPGGWRSGGGRRCHASPGFPWIFLGGRRTGGAGRSGRRW